MKKIFFGILAIVAMVATSCQQETDLVVNGGAATVSFQIEAPQMSRAFSDGNTATVLQYAVYEGTTELTDLTVSDAKGNAATINGSTTVDLQLVTGNTYTVIFWADNVNAPYTVDWANGTLTVDYSDVLSNNEELDAFYAKHEFTVKGAQTETVYLKRPFSQVNIGTSDYAAAKSSGYEPKYSYVKVSNIYKTLKLWDGVVSDEVEVTYKYADIPSGETFPVAGHEYLAMNYLLMAADEQTIDVEFGYGESSTAAEKTRTVGSVPVRRNYRTNIYGQLLTSDVDINVEIKPEYDDVYNNAHDYYVEGNVYYLTSLDGFKWFADQVDGGNTFEGKTVVLDTDIDLSGVTRANGVWTPIGGIEGSHYTINFRGVFDGAGHSVKNFSVNHHQAAGLFGYMVGGTIKNLTVENATFTSNHYAGAIVAWIEQGGKPVVIENCHVKNVTLTSTPELVNGVYDNGDKVGALVGFAHGGEYKNNIVENATVKGYRDLGGLVGYLNKGVVSGNTIKDVTVTQDLTNGYKTDVPTTLGAVVGRYGADNTVENNTVENTNVATLVNNQTELEAALKGGLKSVALVAGEYNLNSVNWNNTLTANEITIAGLDKEACVVTINKQIRAKDGVTVLTLKNLTTNVPTGLNYTEHDFAWIHYLKEFNMINCNSNGRIRLNSHKATIDGCTFDVTTKNGFDGYAVHYQGANGSNVVVKNSTFNTAGKGIVMYNEGSPVFDLDVENCTFVSSDTSTDKAAIQMHTEYGISGTLDIVGCTATGFAAVNGGLWNELNNNTKVPTNKFVVTVDGNVVKSTALIESEAAVENAVVELPSGSYVLPATYANGVTFKGEENTTLVMPDVISKSVTIEGAALQSSNGVRFNGNDITLTLNNCTAVSGVQRMSVGASAVKKVVELFDLATDVLDASRNNTLVIDGTKVNSKTTVIRTADELIAKTSIAAGEVIILLADIDLAGKTFNGLNAFHPENNTTFDGMGYTVSNWTNESGASDFGFIKNWCGPIKNLVIKNAHLKTNGRSAIVAAKVYGDIKNCHVINSTIEDSYWACGIIAGLYNGGSVYGCTVTGSSVKSNGGVGGIVGVLNESEGTRGCYNCSISNSTVHNTGIYGESYSGALICGLINIGNSTVEFEGCTYEGNTKNGKYVGDIYYSEEGNTVIVK